MMPWSMKMKAHGGGRVELLFNGDEVDFHLIELLDQFCEISNVAADSIQAVNYDGPKGWAV